MSSTTPTRSLVTHQYDIDYYVPGWGEIIFVRLAADLYGPGSTADNCGYHKALALGAFASVVGISLTVTVAGALMVTGATYFLLFRPALLSWVISSETPAVQEAEVVPEMLPENFPGIVDPKSPEQIAGKLRLLATGDFSEQLRETFLRRFTLEQHLAKMAEAIRSAESEAV